MHHLRICRKHVLHAAKRLAALVSRVAASAGERWRRHLERMSTESSYAQAFATIVIAIIELVTGSFRIRVIAREVVAAYLAVLRALRRPRIAGHGWDSGWNSEWDSTTDN